MALHVYNTQTRTKERFEPLEPGKVGLYVCGVTVYDLSHIGHARVYVAFDAVFRFLKRLGYEVNYVRNFTDVDDKIIKRAAERGEEPLALSQRFIDEFHVDMDALGCQRPTSEPKVSTHIDEIVAMTEKIIANGHGYVVDGDVYFDVKGFPEYGKLSGRDLEEQRAGERVAVDTRKRHPFDFALWKSAKPGEPTWDSPWGPGRPGWHIECSAMACKHLGETFDIHAGGTDLVFPHHENEVAQSEAASGKPYVRYWLHNGFVNIDAEKMSKSLGNFFTIRDVRAVYHPQAIRFFLLSTHYRAPINYTERALECASGRVFYLYRTLRDLRATLDATDVKDDGPMIQPEALKPVHERFTAAMEDDFNTALVTGLISEPLKIANDLMMTKKGRKRAGRLTTLAFIQKALMPIFSILGVGQEDPERVIAAMKALLLTRQGMTEADVQAAIDARVEARKTRDWGTSDRIRDELALKNIQLMDGSDGTVWMPVYAMDDDNAGGTECADPAGA